MKDLSECIGRNLVHSDNNCADKCLAADFLYLKNNRLSGPLQLRNSALPPQLLELQLQGNLITGSIPNVLGRVPRLGTFRLPGWLLTASCANERALERLDMSSNRLQGNLPRQLSNLIRLRYLALQHNQEIRGTIPPQFGQMRRLDTLLLNGTSLSGRVPQPVCNLQIESNRGDKLSVLEVDCTQLTCPDVDFGDNITFPCCCA